jgi:hypothetical protein
MSARVGSADCLHGETPGDDGARSRRGSDRELAAERRQSVGHPLQAGAVRDNGRVETTTVVTHLECQVAVHNE